MTSVRHKSALLNVIIHFTPYFFSSVYIIHRQNYIKASYTFISPMYTLTLKMTM